MVFSANRFSSLVLFGIALCCAACNKSDALKCEPKFPYSGGWLGADGAYSIALDASRSLWLFGDTFVASRAHQTTREGAVKIHNSVAVSTCDASSGEWAINYFWQNAGTANPKPFFDVGSGAEFYYRPLDGFTFNGSTYVLLQKVRKSSDLNDASGSQAAGLALAKLTGEEMATATVEVEDISDSAAASLGGSVVIQGDYVYAFGSSSSSSVVLTRLELKHLDQAKNHFERLAADGVWRSGLEMKDGKSLFLPAPAELSVRFHADLGKWVAVYSDPTLFSRKVLMRTSSELQGPWSEAQIIYEVPEMIPEIPGYDSQTFCYGAKEHSEFYDDGESLFTYVCSSLDASKAASDMKIYLPKAVTYSEALSPGSGTLVLKASTEGIEKPTPERGFVLNLDSNLSVALSRNESTGRVLKVATSECKQIKLLGVPSGVDVALYHMPEVRTNRPSFRGAIVGAHYDPLVPFHATEGRVCEGEAYIWVDISVSSVVPPGNYSFKIGDLPVSLRVWNLTMPVRPTLPLYMGLGTYSLVRGHGLPLDSGVSKIGPLTMAYVNELRAHRIEPEGQWIKNRILKEEGGFDLDHFGSDQGSFRQLVMNGALAPVCVETPGHIGTPWANAQDLQGWEMTLSNEPDLADAWAYITDEPNDIPGTLDRALLVRTYAPHLKTMVTTEPLISLLGVIDHFTPLFEVFKQPGHWQDYTLAPGYFLYGSCVSHGSCSDDELGELTGTPDLMLDQPTVHARTFPLVAYQLGASAALYYNSTESYGKLDPWTSQFLFGGNGDGTLIYPGIQGTNGFRHHEPVPSLRLKAMRQGLYDVEYLNMAKNAGIETNVGGLIQDQFKWSRNNADYEALRVQIGEALSGI